MSVAGLINDSRAMALGERVSDLVRAAGVGGDVALAALIRATGKTILVTNDTRAGAAGDIITVTNALQAAVTELWDHSAMLRDRAQTIRTIGYTGEQNGR